MLVGMLLRGTGMQLHEPRFRAQITKLKEEEKEKEKEKEKRGKQKKNKIEDIRAGKNTVLIGFMLNNWLDLKSKTSNAAELSRAYQTTMSVAANICAAEMVLNLDTQTCRFPFPLCWSLRMNTSVIPSE
jgi:hypothetical protein